VAMYVAVGSRRCVTIGLVSAFPLSFFGLLRRKSARRSLLIAAAIQPDTLDIVLTRLLVSPVAYKSTLPSNSFF